MDRLVVGLRSEALGARAAMQYTETSASAKAATSCRSSEDRTPTYVVSQTLGGKSVGRFAMAYRAWRAASLIPKELEDMGHAEIDQGTRELLF